MFSFIKIIYTLIVNIIADVIADKIVARKNKK